MKAPRFLRHIWLLGVERIVPDLYEHSSIELEAKTRVVGALDRKVAYMPSFFKSATPFVHTNSPI